MRFISTGRSLLMSRTIPQESIVRPHRLPAQAYEKASESAAIRRHAFRNELLLLQLVHPLLDRQKLPVESRDLVFEVFLLVRKLFDARDQAVEF